MFQSTWSTSEYHVKPSTGTPSWRSRSALSHCFQSHIGASAGSKTLVSVCITGLRYRWTYSLTILYHPSTSCASQ